MKSVPPIPYRLLILTVILSLIGGYFISYGTQWGPAASDDTVEYFEAARNLMAGRGLILRRASGAVSPLSSRLPFYSIVLGAAGFLGMDLLIFARWLNIILFVALILVLGLTTYSLTRQPLLSISISVWMIASPAFLMNYSFALSEPLYFTLGITSMFLLLFYFQNNNRVLLTISSILSGLAFLTRYAGVVFVITGVMGLMVFSRRNLKQRFLEAFYFLVCSCILLLPWVISVYRGGDTPGIYQLPEENLWISLRPVRGALVEGIWRWLPFKSVFPSLPYRYKFALLTLLGLILVISFLIAIRRRKSLNIQNWKKNQHLQLTGLFTLFTATYLLMFVVTYVLVRYPKPGLNERSLSPFQIGGFIAFFSAIYFLGDTYRANRLINLIPLGIALSVIASNIPGSKDLLIDLHNNGRGYTSKEWWESGLIEKVSDLPDEITLISNESEAVLFWTERPAYRIPEIWRRTQLEVYHSFGEDLDDEVQRIFREDGAALLIFNSVFGQLWEIYEDDVQRRMAIFTQGLCKGLESWDGAIYFYECN